MQTVVGLPLHERAHVASDLIGRSVEREVAAVHDVNLGLGYVPPVGLGLGELKREIVLAPHDQQSRLRLPQPGLPPRIRAHVGAIVIEQLGLDAQLSGLAEECELVRPQIRVARSGRRIAADVSRPRGRK